MQIEFCGDIWMRGKQVFRDATAASGSSKRGSATHRHPNTTKVHRTLSPTCSLEQSSSMPMCQEDNERPDRNMPLYSQN